MMRVANPIQLVMKLLCSAVGSTGGSSAEYRRNRDPDPDPDPDLSMGEWSSLSISGKEALTGGMEIGSSNGERDDFLAAGGR